MRATSSRPGAAVTLLAVAAAVLLWAGVARGDEVKPFDLNMTGHRVKNVGAAGAASDVVTLGFVTPGACTLASSAVNGAIVCAGSLGSIGSIVPPLSLSGSVLSLLMDGTSVGNVGGFLARLSLTGAVTAADGSGTTAFGSAGALSVLANPTSSAAVPTYVGPATTGRFFGDLAGTLGWSLVPWASLSGAPTPDGVTIGLTGSNYQRLALTGAVASADGSAATTFGPQSGDSLLGVTGSSTGVPAPIVATADNQVYQRLGGTVQAHTLDFSQLTGAPPAVTSMTGVVVGNGPGATATTFGMEAAHTVLGVSGGSTAVPVFIGPASVRQVFMADPSSGALGWEIPPLVTSSLPGYMSATDKVKIDGGVTPALTTDLLRYGDLQSCVGVIQWTGSVLGCAPTLGVADPFAVVSSTLTLKIDSTLHLTGGLLGVSGLGALTPSLPLAISGSNLVLNFDSSLALSGSNLQVPAYVGAITKAAGSNTTAFGTQSANSFFGVAGGSTAVPAPISCATPGTFAGNVGGTLGCTATIPATSAPLVAGAIGYGSAGGLLTGDATNHHWDGTNFREGIREAAPAYQLHLVDEAGAADRGLVVGTHVASNASSIVGLRKSRGSFASPAAVANTDYLGTYWHEGFDGTSWLRTAQTGAHVTPGGTVAAGSIPTRWYVAVNPAGVTDPYGGTNPINIQTVSTPSALGLLTSVGIGYPPGTSFASLLSMRAVGLSGSGHNARMLLVNPTTGPDQGAVFTMTSDLTSATFTLNSNTSSAAAGINSLVLATTTSGGSIWLSPATLPMVEVVNPVHWGSTFESELAIHQIGTASNGGARATLRLLTDGDTQGGALTQTQSGFTGWEGPNNLTLENLSAGVIQLSTNNSGVNTFAVEPSTSGASSVVQGAALARSATGGMFNIATMPGSPTGTPTVYAGTSPLVVDSTNHALDFNVGGTWYALTPGIAGLGDPGANGIVVRTASNVTTARTLTNSDGTIAGTNLDGVAGNPEIHVNAIPESKVMNLTTDLAAKQATGNYLVGLASAVTATGPGTPTATVHLDAGSTVQGLLPLGNLVNCATGQIVGMVGGVEGCVTPSAGTVYTGTSPVVVSGSTISCPTCTAASLTAGSVVFSGGGGALSQDNTGFFYDGTNHRLGLGLTNPSYPLDILLTANTPTNVRVSNLSAGASAAAEVLASNNAGNLAYFGIGSTAYTGFAPIDGGSAYFGSFSAQASIFTQTANPITFYPDATYAGQFTSGGAFQLVSLSAGGIAKAAATTGQFGIASASDLASAQTWPALTDILVSAGTTSAPVGDSNFTYNTSTHVMTSAGGTVLGGSVVFSGGAGAGEVLLGIGNSGAYEDVFTGSGLSLAGGVLSVGHVYAAATIDYTTQLIFAGPGTPTGWLGTASTVPGLGQIGQVYEYPKFFAASTATLKVVVVHNNMDGSGDVAINITRNGSTIGSAVHVLTTTAPGTVLTIGPVTVSSGATSDTYGTEWNASGTVTNGREIDATSTLVLQ